MRLKFLEKQAKKPKTSAPVEFDSKLPKLNSTSGDSFFIKTISNKEISSSVNNNNNNGNDSLKNFKIPKIKNESDATEVDKAKTSNTNEPTSNKSSALTNFKIPKMKKEPETTNIEKPESVKPKASNTSELSKTGNGLNNTERKHIKLEAKDRNGPKSTNSPNLSNKEKPKSNSSVPVKSSIKIEPIANEANSVAMSGIKIEPIYLDENTPKSTNSDTAITAKKEPVEPDKDKANKHVTLNFLNFILIYIINDVKNIFSMFRLERPIQKY